jgi:dolichol-phosphate mannosyltransferase
MVSSFASRRPPWSGAAVSVHIVLPAYDEAENLPALLTALGVTLAGLERTARVLLVDDGSSDGTGAVAASFASALPIEVLRHDRNLGLGRSLADGLARVLETAADGDAIVTMDADDTHPPAVIPALLAALDGGAELAIASRYVAGARLRGVPLFRRLLSRAASRLVRLVAPVGDVRDVTCGFRAYRAGALRRAAAGRARLVEADGFACMLDLLLTLRAVGAVCVEVPIDLRYDRKRGPSKLRVGRTVVETVRVLRRHRSH